MSGAKLPALLLAVAVWAGPACACTVSANGLAFGPYDTLSPVPTDGTGRVTLECDLLVDAPTVSLSAGLGTNFAPRAMMSGPARLSYNLFVDFTRLSVWGDGAQGTQTVTLTGGAASGGTRRFSRTIYGRIPARQRVGTGIYNDALLVTVAF